MTLLVWDTCIANIKKEDSVYYQELPKSGGVQIEMLIAVKGLL